MEPVGVPAGERALRGDGPGEPPPPAAPATPVRGRLLGARQARRAWAFGRATSAWGRQPTPGGGSLTRLVGLSRPPQLHSLDLVRELQRGERLRHVLGAWRAVNEHGDFGPASQAVREKVCEAGVPVRHMSSPPLQGRDDVPQHAQAPVDALRLLHVRAGGVRARHTLAPREVDEVELRRPSRAAPGGRADSDVDGNEGVRTGRVLVQVGAGLGPVPIPGLQEAEHLPERLCSSDGEPWDMHARPGATAGVPRVSDLKLGRRLPGCPAHVP